MSQIKKLKRPVDFNLDQFNINYEKNKKINKNIKNKINKNKINNKINIIDKNIESYNINYVNDLGINMKNLFFKILEILLNKENPLNYIMENDNNQFTFSIMIIIIGGLLLFLSNLMISN